MRKVPRIDGRSTTRGQSAPTSPQGDTVETQRLLEGAEGNPQQEATFVGYVRQQEAQAGQLTLARERERQAAVSAGRKAAGSSSAHAWNLAMAGALAGRSPEATLLHSRGLAWIRAAAELARGRSPGAIGHLAATKPYDRGEITSHYLRGLAYLQLKSAPEALAAFQTIIDRPQIDQFSIVHPLARLRKARAAAMAGDLATSRTAYQDFLTWWKAADPDPPVLVAAMAEYARLSQ